MATRLPPADKLPLALRKNVRDNWEEKKPDFEKQLSEALSVPWTIDIDPKAIYPYAKEGYAKESLGKCIADYVESAIFKLKYFESISGADGVADLNKLCHAHVLTMDLDEDKKFSYCGCDVKDGKLRILFSETGLAVNISDALKEDTLKKALNEAPADPSSKETLSFAARAGIRKSYDDKIEDVRKKIAGLLEKPDIKLTPNFEENFAKLSEASQNKKSRLISSWETSLGQITFQYFQSLATSLDWKDFGKDEMLREGFNEAVEKGEITFRLVEQLKYDNNCECVVEDGVLYLQAKPDTFGVNVNSVATKIVDQL
ncbi:hypothetical protein NKR23_g4092 [Pleurostoma richardsiae]|uniref:Uncharacterized protein n=1 Tax=Pleurostoma richardsiae TaxID=41990 RepID=A0AA38VSU1_9PEZI|nr:hypothetical protein NKR23_g4092 [Pleurostoma richardsiae]